MDTKDTNQERTAEATENGNNASDSNNSNKNSNKPHRPLSIHRPHSHRTAEKTKSNKNTPVGSPWGRHDQEIPYNGGGSSNNNSNVNINHDGSYDYRSPYGRRHTYGRYEHDRPLGGDETRGHQNARVSYGGKYQGYYDYYGGAGGGAGYGYDHDDQYYENRSQSRYSHKRRSKSSSYIDSYLADEHHEKHQSQHQLVKHQSQHLQEKHQSHQQRPEKQEEKSEKPPTPEFITTTSTEITVTPAVTPSTEPETTDPANLNETKNTKVAPPIIKAFHTGKPNGKRLLLRFMQFLSSAGAFGFIVGAPIYSGETIPFTDKFAVICLYGLSIISTLVSLYTLVIYCIRRFKHGEKLKRWLLLVVDMIFALMWGADVMILIGTNRCTPGDHNHW
ncbi:1606_t:CDS:2 [Ambispora gerdemannii]|uniref:1606_t:CDS:1 n=1 Tax=Ambispora gerdemannii TaxID=144530 RepID=A0A9N9FL16_9GLOM|nr:1606_t:CDS:2 [Ambispora gerdemannii]